MSTTTVRTGTRWPRALIPIVVGLGVLAFFASAMARGVLGLNASLIIENGAADFNSSGITATKVAFGMAPVRTTDPTNGNAAKWQDVLRAGFASATLNGLCVSRTDSIAGIKYTVVLTSGGTAIDAQNAGFDITSLRSTTINLQGSTQIGNATTDLTTTGSDGTTATEPFDSNPLGAPETWAGGFYNGAGTGPNAYDSGSSGVNGNALNGQGWTGIQADKGTLSSIYGHLWQIQAIGKVNLPNLKINVYPFTDGNGDGIDDHSCYIAGKNGNFTD